MPALLSKDSSKSYMFSPIFIDGKIREKVLARDAVLDRNAEQRPDSSLIVETGRKAPETVRYTASVPYSPDMLESTVVLYETVLGCADCLEHTDTLVLSEVLPRYVPVLGPNFVQSPDGDNKDRERHHRADLQYVMNLYDIDPDYADNRMVLDGIMESIRTAMNDTVYTVNNVRFLGYASPDGPEPFNIELSGNRAKGLYEYIRKAMSATVPDSIFVVEGGAEDWDGFFKAVSARADLASNPAILAVRSELTDTNRDSCEFVLKRDHELYDLLRKEILPPLRRTEYVIEYRLRDFTPEEAEKLWQIHPEWLSINELYSVAQIYGEEDPRFLEVLVTTARTYPADLAAVHNAALGMYRAGMAEEALSLLSGRYEPQLLNTLGIIYAGEKMYHEAVNAFTMASSGGYEEASANLAELEKLMEQL